MTDVLLLVIALCALAIVVLVFRIFIDLRLLRIEHIPEVLAALRLLSRPAAHHNGAHGHHFRGHHFFPCSPEDVLGYLIWEWRDGGWQVVAESKAAGIDPGAPPAYPGSFTGERVKTWAPRRIW